MKRDESSYRGVLTDRELDRLLPAAGKELLAHVEATAGPALTLTAPRALTSPAAADGSSAAVTGSRAADKTPAVLAIGMRSSVRQLASNLDRILTRARTLVNELDRARTRARASDLDRARTFASVLDRDVARARDRARDIAYGLDRAREVTGDLDYARELVREIARDLNRARDLNLAHALGRIRDLAGILDHTSARALDLDLTVVTQQVDASGADLSDMAIEDLDVLDGVIWTGQTIWAPGIVKQVRACSREIAPGVYQVGQGNNPDRFALVSA